MRPVVCRFSCSMTGVACGVVLRFQRDDLGIDTLATVLFEVGLY